MFRKIEFILIYKPELSEVVEKKIRSLDLSKYKESMKDLIKKDIDYLLNNFII